MLSLHLLLLWTLVIQNHRSLKKTTSFHYISNLLYHTPILLIKCGNSSLNSSQDSLHSISFTSIAVIEQISSIRLSSFPYSSISTSQMKRESRESSLITSFSMALASSLSNTCTIKHPTISLVSVEWTWHQILLLNH